MTGAAFLADAERALAAQDDARACHGDQQALAIVNELQNTLDLARGGTVAENWIACDFVQTSCRVTATGRRSAGRRPTRAQLAADAWRTLATTPPGATPVSRPMTDDQLAR
jgi:hypothetical protein